MIDARDGETVDLEAPRRLSGVELGKPAEDAMRPHRDALAWHREVRFLGANAA